jgi:hypothetical protein
MLCYLKGSGRRNEGQMTGTLWVGWGGLLCLKVLTLRPFDLLTEALWSCIWSLETRTARGFGSLANVKQLRVGLLSMGVNTMCLKWEGSTRGACGNSLELGNNRRRDLKTDGNQGTLCYWSFPNVCAAARTVNIVSNVQRVVATSQKTQNVFVTQTNLLILFGEDVVAA